MQQRSTLAEFGEFQLQCMALYRCCHSRMELPTKLVIKDRPDSSEWLATVKFLLKLFHLGEYILDPAVISPDQFTTIFK